MAGRRASIIFFTALLAVGIGTAVYRCTSPREAKQPVAETKECFSVEGSLPASAEKLKLLDHKYYMTLYNPRHKQASCVAYLLTAEMVNKNDNVSRKGTGFKKDYLLSKDFATKQDYTNSGYVRGHLCPSKDMCWSFASMQETFYMSNLSPQREKFNNGLWKNLENRVRAWALENDSILVLCGPVLSTKEGEIGENGVSVCRKFYKIVIDISYPTYKMIAFLMDNANPKGSVFCYSCSVRDVERITGLDFFPSQTGNKLIDSLKSTVEVDLWRQNTRNTVRQ